MCMSERPEGRASIWKRLLRMATHRSPLSYYGLFAMFGICALFYYLGELADSAGWQALKWDFLYGVHDFHRLLFLAPIIFAGYVFGLRAAITMTILSTAVFIPRALFISQFPDPLARMLLFSVIAGAVGWLSATARGETLRRKTLEARLNHNEARVLEAFEAFSSGVVVVGHDYQVLYASPSVEGMLGSANRLECYRYFQQGDSPCAGKCALAGAPKDRTAAREYELVNGRKVRVVELPYAGFGDNNQQILIIRDAD